MTSSLRKSKSSFQLSETTDKVEENHHIRSSETLTHLSTLDRFTKCASIFGNIIIGSVIIYNLYYINQHLVEVKDAVENLF